MSITEAKRNARELAETGDDHIKKLYEALDEDDLDKLSEILDEGEKK